VIVVGSFAVMSLRRTDYGNDLRRDVIRNTVGFAPSQFYQALDLTDGAAASGGMLTIAHNAGDRTATTEVALAFGADVIEVDVVAIGNELYAAHDQPNQRIGSVTFRGPTLAEIWNVVDGTSQIEFDLKDTSPRFLSTLISFLEDRGNGEGVIVSSRSFTALSTIHERLPEVTLIYSVGDRATLVALQSNSDLIGLIDGVSIRASLLDSETVDWLKEHDLLVLAWTVNDFASVDALLELGVDGVATDNLAIIEHYDEGS
jgi:glycerophosphoryl diester phosphodiesterase